MGSFNECNEYMNFSTIVLSLKVPASYHMLIGIKLIVILIYHWLSYPLLSLEYPYNLNSPNKQDDLEFSVNKDDLVTSSEATINV